MQLLTAYSAQDPEQNPYPVILFLFLLWFLSTVLCSVSPGRTIEHNLEIDRTSKPVQSNDLQKFKRKEKTTAKRFLTAVPDSIPDLAEGEVPRPFWLRWGLDAGLITFNGGLDNRSGICNMHLSGSSQHIAQGQQQTLNIRKLT